MAANKESQGLQIALIILVLLTISLAVTTFIFFKENEENVIARNDAVQKMNEMDQALKEANRKTNRLKDQLVGKRPSDSVEGIVEDKDADMKLVAGTYPEPARDYPTALSNMLDAYLKLQQVNVDLVAHVQSVEAEQKKIKLTADTRVGEYRGALDRQVKEIIDIHGTIAGVEIKNQKQLEEFDDLLRQKRAEIVRNKDEAVKKQEALARVIKAERKQLAETKKELLTYKQPNIDRPDGEVTWAARGIVWINVGRADGLRKGTPFDVFDSDASESSKPEAKGTIEVIRILDSHRAEARIINDRDSDPIQPQDKIFSPVFRPGQPERFAFAGLIDIDGDGRSDLPELRSLVLRGGGAIDAVVDDQGRWFGEMTVATRFLVLGEPPTENVKNDDLLKNYTRIQIEAEKLGVKTIGLSTFLEHMNYEGRERSIDLGPRARADDNPHEGGKGRDVFRKRPT